MPLTQVQICNLALMRVGVQQFISAISDQLKEAEVCNLVYTHVRDLALEDLDWKFARKRLELSDQAEPPTKPDEWGYQYQVPADMIRALYIEDALQIRRNDERSPFRIENPAGTAQILYTDMEDAVLIYTQRITDEAQFPPHFSDYFAWSLAVEITMPLVGDAAVKRQMIQEKNLSLGDAFRRNFSGEQENQEPDSQAIAVRS